MRAVFRGSNLGLSRGFMQKIGGDGGGDGVGFFAGGGGSLFGFVGGGFVGVGVMGNGGGGSSVIIGNSASAGMTCEICDGVTQPSFTDPSRAFWKYSRRMSYFVPAWRVT